jgi:two-component system, chemotaxis family, protein-glutamate methylesterase/glutaminase
MTQRVLIVDDSLLMRTVIRSIVSADDSFEIVGEAVDGIEGVEKATALRPDIILLDIEMPRLDGIGALKQLRLVSVARVIVVSSAAQLGSPQALEARRLGASDVIAKPSGALSLDLQDRRGHAIVLAMRKACGLDA